MCCLNATVASLVASCNVQLGSHALLPQCHGGIAGRLVHCPAHFGACVASCSLCGIADHISMLCALAVQPVWLLGLGGLVQPCGFLCLCGSYPRAALGVITAGCVHWLFCVPCRMLQRCVSCSLCAGSCACLCGSRWCGAIVGANGFVPPGVGQAGLFLPGSTALGVTSADRLAFCGTCRHTAQLRIMCECVGLSSALSSSHCWR